MATDLDSVYFATREALPHLLKTKGSIINLSSASGLGGDWGLSAYNAAKGAVTNFTRALRSSTARVACGSTPWHRVSPPVRPLPISRKTKRSWQPLLIASRSAGAATPDEIAGVIAFLASEDAVFINGVILPVDGGLHASNGQPNFLSLLGQG